MSVFKKKIKEFFPFVVFILAVGLLLVAVLRVAVIRHWQFLGEPLPDLFQGVSFEGQGNFETSGLEGFFPELKEEKDEGNGKEELTHLNNAIQGLFTELFSGQGWKNKEKSDIYQDFNLSTISFPPDYEWEELILSSKKVSLEGNKLKDEKIISIGGNGREVVLVNDKGEVMVFNKEGELFKESPSFLIREDLIKKAFFDYDSDNDKWSSILFSENNVYINIFKVKKMGIVFTLSEILEKKSFDLKNSSFSCLEDKCFFSSGNQLFSFSLNSVEEGIKEEMRDNFKSISVFKTDVKLILGKVSEEGDSKVKIEECNSNLENCRELINFSSKYEGVMHFGYNNEKNNLFSLYSAYIGSAHKINLDSFKTEDYSDFFPQRVMDNSVGGGDSELFPFSQDDTWWFSSILGKKGVKILRVKEEVGIDITPSLLKGVQNFQLVPGFEDKEIYGIVRGVNDSWLYKLTDKGFRESNVLFWESSKINSLDGEVTKGRIKKVEGEENGGHFSYFLSNNGGNNWTEVKFGELIIFNKRGEDFRWRVEFSSSENKFKTPWLKTATIEYYIIKE